MAMNRPGTLDNYADALLDELEALARVAPGLILEGVQWGGGTPGQLGAARLQAVGKRIAALFDRRCDAEVSLEIDPRHWDREMAVAAAAIGVTRVSLGVQDFDEGVQAAINRRQSFEDTADALDRLRAVGIRRVNIDLVYGLPRQTLGSLAATLDLALKLGPDRFAVFGYAHVPWMKPHQKLIDEATLPDDALRAAMSALVAERLVAAGYRRIGLDHYARPGDRLARAAADGTLHRNFQGYVADRAAFVAGIGASATSVAAGFAGELALGTYPQFGLGESLGNLLQYTELDDIVRWLPLDISPNVVREYLFQKSLYPGTLPATKDEQSISQAIARQVLYLAVRTLQKDFPTSTQMAKMELMPKLDLIIGGGGVISDGVSLGQSLLLLLDAIQPVGIMPILIDQNNLLPLLGAAAERNNYLPVQVIDSGAFIGVGTVISVNASANYGDQVLRAKLTYADGTDARVDVKFGGLEILPLPNGQSARLSLQPLNRADAGLGAGRSGTVSVTGGALGVVIDARGRPLKLPSDAVRRRELIKKWYYTVGG